MKKVWRAAWRYKWLSVALLAAIIGLALQLSGFKTEAKWLLGTVSLAAAVPLVWDMITNLRHGKYGIDILAATAIVTSVVLGEVWAAIVLVIMLTGGESLEAYAERRAHAELDSLLKRAPQIAHVIRSRKTVDVKASDVHPGDKIIVKPGEIVPVDAEILEGLSTFDESNLTGESLPVERSLGQQILSGSINQDAVVTAKALHGAADSQYQQIVALVKSAAASKAPFVRMADAYSIPFTIAAFAIAGAAWFVSGDAHRFLEVLVVATPCPLLLAAPIALVSGMARASKYGIIVKTGSALEKLAKVQTMAFDKTGTLTRGELSVASIKTFGKATQADVLSLAAALEKSSNHVVAAAVVQAADKRGLKAPRAKHVKEVPGHGLVSQIGGMEVLAGNLELMKKYNVTMPKHSVSGTAIYVAQGGNLQGIISLADSLRPETKDTLGRLRKLGIGKTLLITGDSPEAARPIAKELRISDLYAQALPGEKLQILEGLTQRPVAFVGDGVNDAPSLTAADVGIAIGARGATAASESADLVIMPNDISRVADAVQIAQRTFSIARQSILVGIGLSLTLMVVFSTGRFTALMGAVVQEVVDVVVIFNALRAHNSRF